MTTVTTPAPAAAQAKPAAGHHAAAGKSAPSAPASPADAFAELLAAMADDAGADTGAGLSADAGDAATQGDAATTKLGADAAAMAAAAPLPTAPTSPNAWIAAMLPATVAKADARVATAASQDGGKAEAVGAGPTASRGPRDLAQAFKADDKPGAQPAAGAPAAPHPHASLLAAAASEKAGEQPREDTSAIANLTATPALPHAHAAEAANTVRLPADSPVKAEVHQAALPSHPLDAAFAGDIAAEVKLMADGGLKQAELRLNPAELGPVHIKLELQATTADVQFTAAHATTREGLSQALPQLRELLAGQGLQLGHAGVGAGTGQGSDSSAWQAQREAARAVQRNAGAGGADESTAAPAIVTRRLQAGRGLLDLYA
ncbi:flagellar hook-length control protein FliK [Ramlibacter humi]|uniref:Flagellar hook-length control protein FliK n=1 Tax=Ramlibacter humi TaxID=2530451 RepID=A0A4Z0CAH2_9BURK|nr:flagellar hook-length control protein FliK [Ramlibacter humi]TFZ08341.1 flagellar hook-length control protein FliK [Ramlibacter humi]